jgi:fucose 4-O-acetylase-like acetyltransferase
MMTGAVILIRAVAPDVIRYPSEMVQQMGPGSFFYRLGLIGGIAALGWLITRFLPGRFSPMRQLGQTSLLIYWVHIEFCYGHLADPIKRKLSVPQATAWVTALTLAMLGLSIVKTRHGRAIGRWVAARARAFAPRLTGRARAGTSVDGP